MNKPVCRKVVYVNAETHRRLAIMAAERGISRAELVAELVANRLRPVTQAKPKEEAHDIDQ